MAENKPIYVVLETFEDDETETPEKKFLINFADRRTRDWVNSTLHWAMCNNRYVQLQRASPDDMETLHIFTPREKETA